MLHGEGLVLGGFHDFALTRSLVVDATEMEDAVDDDTVQFLVVGTTKLICVSEDRVEGDDDISVQGLSLGVVEGDDVGIIVMAQVLVVHFEDLVVVDEQIADFTDLFSIRLCHATDPVGRLALLDVGELHPFCIVCDHGFISFGEDRA